MSQENEDKMKYSRMDDFSPAGVGGNGGFYQSQVKTAETDAGVVNPSLARGAMNVMRNPSRTFYQPDLSSTAIMLPKTLKMVNRWCRWIFDHDELVETVLRYHAELPYSQFEMEVDDPFILRMYEDQIDRVKLFSKLPELNLEYLKLGEVFPYTPWDSKTGMFSHLEALNSDYVEVSYTPFANDGTMIELIPDDDLKKLVNSTKPEDQELKKRIPREIVSRVLTGRNLPLKSEEVTHIARRSSPYDVRGTSMLRKIFRLYQYQDKLREAQITIADNFIYPLKIFKLGDPASGWIPDASHQTKLAQMLQQSQFDPNFALIYHYALDVEYVTVADKVMSLGNEWDEINKQKMIALGVSAAFIDGSQSYSSANVGLQSQLARYKANRDLFEQSLIVKMFQSLAEKHEWYKRDKREINNGFRVSRSGYEKQERLILPEIIWNKKLAMREDQSYLAFLNNVYNQGKGPISAITFLREMGYDTEQEIKRKKKLKVIENRIGEKLISALTPGQGAPATPGAPAGATASFFTNLKARFGKQEEEKKPIVTEDSNIFVKEEDPTISSGMLKISIDTGKDSVANLDFVVDHTKFATDTQWFENLKSPKISQDVYILFTELSSKLNLLNKKVASGFELDDSDIHNIFSVYKKLYLQGKISAYSLFNNDKYSSLSEESIYDYADEALLSEFKGWIHAYQKSENKDNHIKFLRSLGNTVFAYGQLRAYEINGVSYVKLSNVQVNRGMSYAISDLLKYRFALSLIVSPREEIVFFNPKIEYFKQFVPEDLNLYLEDPNLYKNYSYSSVNVKNAPIEYISDLNTFIKIAGKNFPYKTIEFVNSITDTDVWMKQTKAKYESEYKAADEKEKGFLIQTAIQLDKVKTSSSQSFYSDDKTLYISKSVDTHDNTLLDKLFNNINIVSSSLEKNITTVFDRKFCDLTPEELLKLASLGVIEPIVDSYDTIQSYKIASSVEDSFNLDERVKIGKIWDINGKALHSDTREPMDIFKAYFVNYAEFPHNMNKEISKLFAKVLG